MKSINCKQTVIFLCVVLAAIIPPFTLAAEDVNQCVKCHTSGRSLIATTREISLEIGDAPLESPESVGEG